MEQRRHIGSKDLRERTEENNFSYLFAGMIALICLVPIIDSLSRDQTETAFILLLLFMSGTLVIASWSIKVKRRSFLAGVTLASTALLLSIAAALAGSSTLGYLSLVVHIAFYSLATWIACVQVLSVGPVTTNRIIGSICVYMMVAVIFALLNVLVNWFIPGSFTNLGASNLPEQMTEFLYYSYVTLNTLGYGDISPVRSLARILAMLEVTFGVFYLAILVASLVGIQISHRGPESQDPPQTMLVPTEERTSQSSKNEQ